MRSAPEELQNYPGNKGIRDLYKNLISEIPPHEVYLELFAGSAVLYQHIKPAGKSFLCDIDVNVFNAWQKHFEKERNTDTIVTNTSALIALEHIRNWGDNCFLYMDPPYPIKARLSKGKIYRHEMTDEDHRQLLTMARVVKCNCMISTNPNPIYEEMLSDWRKLEYPVSYRGKVHTEVVYMNYEKPRSLHDDRYLGACHLDRQRIKRKLARLMNKLRELPDLEREYILKRLQ